MPAAYLLRLALICRPDRDVRDWDRLGPLHAQAGARERTLFVSALDSRGEPVEGLNPE